ncbi:hypothetical protein [Mycolicibacterium sp. A43C]
MTTIPGIGEPLQDNGSRGLLAFTALPAELQRREDSTLAADRARWDAGWSTGQGLTWKRIKTAVPGIRREGVEPAPTWVRAFDRAATNTERELLQHLGYELPDDLVTRVTFFGPVRNRRWPQLTNEEH